MAAILDPIVRGRRALIQLTFQDKNPVTAALTPHDLTGEIIRAFFYRQPEDNEDDAEIAKRSYSASEINITNALGGIALLTLGIADTIRVLPRSYRMVVDVTGRAAVRTSGTLNLTAGSRSAVLATGSAAAIQRGDLLVPTGTAGNNIPVRVVAVSPSQSSVVTDYTAFVTEAGANFMAYEGTDGPVGGMIGEVEFVNPGGGRV